MLSVKNTMVVIAIRDNPEIHMRKLNTIFGSMLFSFALRCAASDSTNHIFPTVVASMDTTSNSSAQVMYAIMEANVLYSLPLLFPLPMKKRLMNDSWRYPLSE